MRVYPWIAMGVVLAAPAPAETSKTLVDVPAYDWHYGCFGTSCGILFGYWDRHGYPNLYTGPTNGGVAPSSSGTGNTGIVSLWASRAGVDGRAADDFGHVDDYYVAYENEGPDPYEARGFEHAPDCVGDFIGLSQRKWTNLNGECNGNRDAYSFNYFDDHGLRRVDFQPGPEAGLPATDVQSGIRAFMAHRGYPAESFSQLADVWIDTPAGRGFTFEDLVAEVEAGYLLQIMLQDQAFANAGGFNPEIHSVTVAGYRITDAGVKQVRIRTGWTSVTTSYDLKEWNAGKMFGHFNSYIRGVIGFRPTPKVMGLVRDGGDLTVDWHGPTGTLQDNISGAIKVLHWYVLEAADRLDEASFVPISGATSNLTLTVSDPSDDYAYLRVRKLIEVPVPDPALHAAMVAAVPAKFGPADRLFDLDLETIPGLSAPSAGITDLTGLRYATGLTTLDLDHNRVVDLAPLVANAEQGGLGAGDSVSLVNNPLGGEALTVQIPALQAQGVAVDY